MKITKNMIILMLISLIIFVGVVLFKDQKYNLVIILLVTLKYIITKELSHCICRFHFTIKNHCNPITNFSNKL